MRTLLRWLSLMAVSITTMQAQPAVLTEEMLRSCQFDDIGAEAIWLFYVELIDQQTGDSYLEMELKALEKMSPQLRDTCILLRYALDCWTTGTQAAALEDGKADTEKVLKMTSKAYQKIGDKERSKMMETILSKYDQHMEELDDADKNDALSDFVSPLDRYDQLWEDVEFDWIEAIKKQIDADPKKFVYPQPNSKQDAGGKRD